MKRHLHFNCFSGAAGDMILSALVDLGADDDALDRKFRALDIGIGSIRFSEVQRGGMRGRYMSIETSDNGHTHPHPHTAWHADEQEDNHIGACAHRHSLQDRSNHGHTHGPHRHLPDMLAIVERSGASPAVMQRANVALRLLAAAEGRVHGISPDKVHFHELSGIDTIVDVIGSCMALEMLHIDSISASRGTVRCAHGVFAVPAPATLAILADAEIPYEQGDMEGEYLTPTGTALLAVMAGSFGASPAMRPERIGYGAGTKECEGYVNLLQATLGICE